MNKHKFQLQKSYAFARKHAHGAVALLCGGMIGVLVVTFAGDGFTKFEEPDVWRESPQELPPLIESIAREPISSTSSASSSVSRVISKGTSRSLQATSPPESSSEKQFHGAAETREEATNATSSAKISVQPEESSVSSVSYDSSVSSSDSSDSSPARTSVRSDGDSSVSSQESFPPFIKSSWPIASVPNWGNMHSASEWNRSFNEMTDADRVPIPAYNLSILTIPMESLLTPWDEANVPKITAKLFYSTRYMGRYDVDAGEFTGDHDGFDLKLAPGTPLGAAGGGKVRVVGTNDRLGIHVIIEHRLKNGETYFSIYGHLAKAGVSKGESVVPGQYIGNVGMTGKTTAPHLHLQMAKGSAGQDPALLSDANSVHPLNFIGQWRGGE